MAWLAAQMLLSIVPLSATVIEARPQDRPETGTFTRPHSLTLAGARVA